MEAQRIAVLAPGANYPTSAPLLFYARLAVERRGGEVRPVTWRLPEGVDDNRHRIDVIRGQVAEALGDDNALIIGKSLGSIAAELAAERALPAIWLTPLLTVPEVVNAIAAAAHPPLLIGGDADRLWDAATARRLSPHVLEIPGADHALHVPGPVSATTAVAGRVADALEAFIDDHVWRS
jgi:pimeloyl-ACP methyl ester carboxylesterase